MLIYLELELRSERVRNCHGWMCQNCVQCQNFGFVLLLHIFLLCNKTDFIETEQNWSVKVRRRRIQIQSMSFPSFQRAEQLPMFQAFIHVTKSVHNLPVVSQQCAHTEERQHLFLSFFFLKIQLLIGLWYLTGYAIINNNVQMQRDKTLFLKLPSVSYYTR